MLFINQGPPKKDITSIVAGQIVLKPNSLKLLKRWREQINKNIFHLFNPSILFHVYFFRVRVEISNQGRNPSTFAATFKKRKGPVRSGFSFFGNKNNASRQCTGTTGFKKNSDRVNEGKVTSKFCEKSPDERNSRKETLILKSREYSIPKSYSTRVDQRENCEEKFESKRDIKTEEKWKYGRHKEDRQTLR